MGLHDYCSLLKMATKKIPIPLENFISEFSKNRFVLKKIKKCVSLV